jgi:ribonuclease HI
MTTPSSGRREALPQVELYTDGACSGNPGPGGWAFILRHAASGKELEQSGGEASTTNNRMELLAVINGLQELDKPCSVDLYSDSQYVINGLKEWMDGWKAKGWKRGRNEQVKNVALWQILDDLRHRHRINYHWIRGHNEHPENERCDRLAVAAIERLRAAGR